MKMADSIGYMCTMHNVLNHRFSQMTQEYASYAAHRC